MTTHRLISIHAEDGTKIDVDTKHVVIDPCRAIFLRLPDDAWNCEAEFDRVVALVRDIEERLGVPVICIGQDAELLRLEEVT